MKKETTQESLKSKREHIKGEISLYDEREQSSLQEFMFARNARKELEELLNEIDTAIELLEEKKC